MCSKVKRLKRKAVKRRVKRTRVGVFEFGSKTMREMERVGRWDG
jgi:hypothetical protein